MPNHGRQNPTQFDRMQQDTTGRNENSCPRVRARQRRSVGLPSAWRLCPGRCGLGVSAWSCRPLAVMPIDRTNPMERSEGIRGRIHGILHRKSALLGAAGTHRLGGALHCARMFESGGSGDRGIEGRGRRRREVRGSCAALGIQRVCQEVPSRLSRRGRFGAAVSRLRGQAELLCGVLRWKVVRGVDLPDGRPGVLPSKRCIDLHQVLAVESRADTVQSHAARG